MQTNEIKNLLDILVFVVKYKKTLFFTALITGIISYSAIYFFVEEQFDSKALVIPSSDDNMSSLVGMLGDIQGLPFGLGSSTPEMSMYTNIIYSRTMLEEIIKKFNLIEIFKLDTTVIDYKIKALEQLSDNITAEENDFMAFEIAVRSPNPKLSADITNFIIKRLNEKLLEIKIKKSQENRIFLADRVKEIKENLRVSEDSLMVFQGKTGLFEAQEQVKGILGVYTSLETELLSKEIQLSILKKIRTEDSPELQNTKVQVEEYKSKLKALKENGSDDDLVLGLESLPQNLLNFLRLYREVEINSKILEFVLPLYEQAKLEEQKDLPVLAVIDYGVPAPKKSYPPRAVFTILVTMGVLLIIMFLLIALDNKAIQNSQKMQYVKKNLFRWRNIN